jgi:hypothetical protein
MPGRPAERTFMGPKYYDQEHSQYQEELRILWMKDYKSLLDTDTLFRRTYSAWKLREIYYEECCDGYNANSPRNVVDAGEGTSNVVAYMGLNIALPYVRGNEQPEIWAMRFRVNEKIIEEMLLPVEQVGPVQKVVPLTPFLHEGRINYVWVQGWVQNNAGPPWQNQVLTAYLYITQDGGRRVDVAWAASPGEILNTYEQVWSIRVGWPTITFSPATLPNGTAGSFYGQVITASGGWGNLTLSDNIHSGDLPSGLTVSGSGDKLTIRGTPTTTGSVTFSVTATDSSGRTGTQIYTLTIAPAEW